ncbi:AAA family ATPase [Sinobaca sp. H24]|uniref:ATP-binding protein n=1 Tax=Sinobaca sp. H24 TaxID=2923376 RepID=UPI002079586F|nr:AAA family ATPase [Sinobaca sp. H24]
MIHETYPSYSNLFGKIDPKPTLPSLEADVSMLTGGALHRANGGYLILEAAELLSHPYCWQALKQMLRSGLLRMEALANEAAGGFRSPLKPEPLPVDIKVILIGTFSQFDYLFQIDEVFRKLFRVKVEFETSMERTFSAHRGVCRIYCLYMPSQSAAARA